MFIYKEDCGTSPGCCGSSTPYKDRRPVLPLFCLWKEDLADVWAVKGANILHMDRHTCFKPYLPVFAIKVAIDDCPKNISPMWKWQSMEKEGHRQGRKLGELRFYNSPQAEKRKPQKQICSLYLSPVAQMVHKNGRMTWLLGMNGPGILERFHTSLISTFCFQFELDHLNDKQVQANSIM